MNIKNLMLTFNLLISTIAISQTSEFKIKEKINKYSQKKRTAMTLEVAGVSTFVLGVIGSNLLDETSEKQKVLFTSSVCGFGFLIGAFVVNIKANNKFRFNITGTEAKVVFKIK